MQGEHLWHNLNSTVMAGNFDGTYQQQGFNSQFLSSFVHNPVPNIEISSAYSSVPATPGQPETTQVKMGLKALIKMKYSDSELPRIEMREPEPPKPKVKEEDPEVIKKRRERNKIAATKCRRRKRERIATLEKRTNKIRAETRLLEQERAKLLKEKQSLMDSFSNHCCKLPQASNYQSVLVPQSSNVTAESSPGEFLKVLATLETSNIRFVY